MEEDDGGPGDLVLLGGQRVGALEEGDAGPLGIVVDMLQLGQDRIGALILLLICEERADRAIRLGDDGILLAFQLRYTLCSPSESVQAVSLSKYYGT